jgi:hypothetical protein
MNDPVSDGKLKVANSSGMVSDFVFFAFTDILVNVSVFIANLDIAW